LSFLGLGAPQDYADWGQIISYSRGWQGPEFWYTILFPALGMVLFVLAWNLIGDALRDIFDPRLG
jgi:peptide/nickel transport system permease protein